MMIVTFYILNWHRMESTKTILLECHLFTQRCCFCWCCYFYCISLGLSLVVALYANTICCTRHDSVFIANWKLKNLFTAHKAIPISRSSPAFVAAFSVEYSIFLLHVHRRSIHTHIYCTLYSGAQLRSHTHNHSHAETTYFFLNGGLSHLFGRACARALLNSTWMCFYFKTIHCIIVWLNPTHLYHLLDQYMYGI